MLYWDLSASRIENLFRPQCRSSRCRYFLRIFWAAVLQLWHLFGYSRLPIAQPARVLIIADHWVWCPDPEHRFWYFSSIFDLVASHSSAISPKQLPDWRGYTDPFDAACPFDSRDTAWSTASQCNDFENQIRYDGWHGCRMLQIQCGRRLLISEPGQSPICPVKLLMFSTLRQLLGPFHAVNDCQWWPAIVIMWANQPVAVHGNSSQIIPRPKQEHNNAT